MRSFLGALVVMSSVGLACRPSAPPQSIVVGAHALSFRLPEGWERIDYGQRQVLRHAEDRIVLMDLGPVDGPGYIREIEAVRDLWIQGRQPDAQARLNDLQLLPFGFSTRAEYLRAHALLVQARQALGSGPAYECNWRLRTVVDTIATQPAPPLSAYVEYVLDRLEPSRYRQREILPPKLTRIGDREALIVDSWDRLSHTQRQRFALTINAGRLLVIAVEAGAFEATQTPYSAVLKSIEFQPTVSGTQVSS
jgi:hypothetical protein